MTDRWDVCATFWSGRRHEGQRMLMNITVLIQCSGRALWHGNNLVNNFRAAVITDLLLSLLLFHRTFVLRSLQTLWPSHTLLYIASVQTRKKRVSVIVKWDSTFFSYYISGPWLHYRRLFVDWIITSASQSSNWFSLDSLGISFGSILLQSTLECHLRWIFSSNKRSVVPPQCLQDSCCSQ